MLYGLTENVSKIEMVGGSVYKCFDEEMVLTKLHNQDKIVSKIF